MKFRSLQENLRKALWERLQFSLQGEPDPWFEHDKAAVDKRQFIPIVPAAQARPEEMTQQ